MSSLLERCAKLEDVQDRINKRYNSLFHYNAQGEHHPNVCCVCDEFLLSPNDLEVISVKKMKAGHEALLWSKHPDPRRTKAIEKAFRWSGDDGFLQGNMDWVNKIALSPRAFSHRVSSHGNAKRGFPACSKCKSSIDNKLTPQFAIANKCYVGCAPKCLLDLNKVELALLSPVKNHGYCFSWEGGLQMKGTLTFMRTEKRGIAKAVTQLQTMGFTKHILILYKGKMTKRQKGRAEEQSKIRTDYVIKALEWLVNFNHQWKDVDLDELKKELDNIVPTVVDKSAEVDETNQNVQQTELFTCYYPEAIANQVSGGFDEHGAFKEFVEEQSKNGFDVQFQMNLEKEFVKGDDDDILVNGSLLQFPCGICGLDDDRKTTKGDYKEKTDLREYIEHLSKLSQTQFQHPMFQLVMCSLTSKFRLLRMSRLQLRNPLDAKAFAEGINAKDVTSTIQARRIGNYQGGTRISRKLLESVDACTKELPHSNEASKKARAISESMQHHFGMASVFLTVVFDDENSFLMQVLTGIKVDDGQDVSTLSDDELSDRAAVRKSIRINYPGLAALNFEMLHRIMTEEVCGWDTINNCPTEEPGFLGECCAFSDAKEEQGRSTIHAHMTLWIKGYKEKSKEMFFGKPTAKKRAERTTQDYYDHVSTTEFFPTRKRDLLTAFDHECDEPDKKKRHLPQIVDDQGLRNLRHRKGYKAMNGKFAACPDCLHEWTYEDMVADNMKQGELFCAPCGGAAPVNDEQGRRATHTFAQRRIPKARMLATIMEFQRDRCASRIDTPKTCIAAGYQHHLSCHVAGCFKCQKKGYKRKAHVCGPNCECRYRLPDCKRQRVVIHTEINEAKWFEWNGNKVHQPLVQIRPRRNDYDLFQNVCCTALSHSKLACNSNIQLITDGPIGQCQHKHQTKQNQTEESADYKQVEDAVRGLNGRAHDADRSEALRVICEAAFAQNRNNVISPPFASFLTRHESRFYFSHEFQWCPLKDVMRLHNDQDISGVLKLSDKGVSFFESAALNYLCRHEELERCSLKEFTEDYYGTFVPKENDDLEVMPHQADTGHFRHPSVIKTGVLTGKCRQGVGARLKRCYVKVAQWMFPDTAEFRGDITSCRDDQVNKSMEVHAQTVLTLLMAHRCKDDLKVSHSRYPYAMKFRAVYKAEMAGQLRQTPVLPKVFTEANLQFLQNIQNCRANSLRYQIKSDDLSSRTVPFENDEVAGTGNESDDEDDNNDDADVTGYESFMDALESQHTPASTDNDSAYLPATLKSFKFGKIRKRGKHECGSATWYEPEDYVAPRHPFLRRNSTSTGTTTQTATPQKARRLKCTVDSTVKVLLRKVTTRSKQVVWKDKSVQVTPAIGSAKSIREWSKAALGTDRRQQRAFESIISSFILTFYDEAPEFRNDATTEAGATRAKFRRSQKALRTLKGGQKEDQLICLLHGPGGSGKSTVINLVIAYAKEFCHQLGHPFQPRTIVVTAMSGVAATLLSGETTHSALALNKEPHNITQQCMDTWEDTRLVIIDEISFAAPSDIKTIYEHAKLILRENFKHYGGTNMVFAGDYSQLVPVNKECIYNGDEMAEFHGVINCFMELDGAWRFKDDPVWGEVLRRFREGVPTIGDIQTINDQCHIDNKPLPGKIQVATWTNKDRDAVNTAIFEECCQHNRPDDNTVFEGAVMVFMDDLSMETSMGTLTPIKSNMVKRHFYENCSEDFCKTASKKGRVDPALKLYPGCPMMLALNTDVPNGEANGSRVFLQSIDVKCGEDPFELRLDCGTTIQGLFVSQVESITVRHENQDINPPLFKVIPQKFNFKCTLKVGTEDLNTKMSGFQFPIISNSCATGHKLQGCTVEALLANDWHYKGNWAYVVLSRVKTMAGLYLRRRLTTDLTKCAMPQNMKDMIAKFKQTCALRPLSDQECHDLCTDSEYRIPTVTQSP